MIKGYLIVVFYRGTMSQSVVLCLTFNPFSSMKSFTSSVIIGFSDIMAFWRKSFINFLRRIFNGSIPEFSCSSYRLLFFYVE